MDAIFDETERDAFKRQIPDADSIRRVKNILDPETDRHKAWAEVRFLKAKLEQMKDSA